MIIRKTILLDNLPQIDFGIAETEEEISEMFKLRYEVYVDEKKYIPNGIYQQNLDIDEYDKEKACQYFIAKMKGKIVGTLRVIRTEVLPTEKEYFKFETPRNIKNIPRNQRAEIGRIISRPTKLLNIPVPRSLVMLGLFYAAAEYGVENNILGGYGSLKSSALKKFSMLNIPIHKIRNSKLVYQPNSSDPLKNFFSKEDPVVLVYFITEEVLSKLRGIFGKDKYFEKVDSNTFKYKAYRPNFIDKIIFVLSYIPNSLSRNLKYYVS